MTAFPSPVRIVGPALLLAAVSLSGCAAKLPKLPVCDGKHRRDANPYGTVLPGAPVVVPTPTPGHPDPVEPAPPPPDKTSASAPHLPYSSC